jgi:hypothetical protein
MAQPTDRDRTEMDAKRLGKAVVLLKCELRVDTRVCLPGMATLGFVPLPGVVVYGATVPRFRGGR